MKKILLFTVSVGVLLFTTIDVFAQNSTKIKKGKQQKHGTGFVDLDGDGYNDNAPDDDGDGIPNGLDPDYEKKSKNGFVDLDGDGINDNAGFGKRKSKAFRTALKNQKESLKNEVINMLEVGEENFNNNNIKGFGFENKFGNNLSNDNGTGTYNGPWNWGWRNNYSGNSGSGNDDGGSGDFEGPWNWGWGNGGK